MTAEHSPAPPHSAVDRLIARHIVAGILQTIASPRPTAWALQAGADFVIIDCEHGDVDEAAHTASLQVLAQSPAFSVVRVKPRDLTAVKFYISQGADVVLMPNVSAAEEARAFVAAADIRDAQRRRARPILMAMIESAAGVSDIEAIAATDGLSGLVIGPNDLARDLGPGISFSSPDFETALRAIESAARDHGLILGGGLYPGISRERLIGAGHSFILTGSDKGLLLDSVRQAISNAHGADHVGTGHG